MRRSLVGEQARAHRGVDAVRADQHVAGHGGQRVVGEPDPDAVRGPLDAVDPVPGTDRVGPQPCAHGVGEHPVHPAAVPGDLREGEPGRHPAGPAQDRPAEPVGVGEVGGRDTDLGQLRGQAEPVEDPHGVRQQVEPDTELARAGALLDDRGPDPGPLQREGRGQSSDTPTDDQDVHSPSLTAERP